MKSNIELKKLTGYIEHADYTDIKMFKGPVSLRQFIAGMLSYYPWWIVGLYRIRTIVVKILGLVEHKAPEVLPDLKPQEISFIPGKRVTFFIVRKAKEDSYWISETPEDNHLRAYFSVLVKPLNHEINQFSVVTAIYYKHWTGPVYFNLIRPFHHLVVSQMARAGLKNHTQSH
jgi:hypothetical protein